MDGITGIIDGFVGWIGEVIDVAPVYDGNGVSIIDGPNMPDTDGFSRGDHFEQADDQTAYNYNKEAYGEDFASGASSGYIEGGDWGGY